MEFHSIMWLSRGIDRGARVDVLVYALIWFEALERLGTMDCGVSLKKSSLIHIQYYNCVFLVSVYPG